MSKSQLNTVRKKITSVRQTQVQREYKKPQAGDKKIAVLAGDINIVIQQLNDFFILFPFWMGGIKPRSSHMLVKFSASELDLCPLKILHAPVSILGSLA